MPNKTNHIPILPQGGAGGEVEPRKEGPAIGDEAELSEWLWGGYWFNEAGIICS